MDNPTEPYTNNADDYLNTSVIFGGVTRTIISKNFIGGQVTNLFGGTKLDFTYADINGRAVLDISQAFGETQITIPRNWRVEPHTVHFLSTVEDKRRDFSQASSADKILVLKGFSTFASVVVVHAL